MPAMTNDVVHHKLSGRMWWFGWIVVLLGTFAVVGPWLMPGSPLIPDLFLAVVGLFLLAAGGGPLVQSIEIWCDQTGVSVAECIGSYRLRTTRLPWTDLDTAGLGWSPLVDMPRATPIYHLHLQRLPALLFDGGRRDFYFGKLMNIEPSKLRAVCVDLAERLYRATGRKPEAPRVEDYAS